ncbi:MAG: hypothetical protein ACP5JG_07200 [Anaerolineae bacterium]
MNKQVERNDETVDRNREGEARPGEVVDREKGPSSVDSWRRQIIGALIGGFIALILSGLAVQLGWIEGRVVNHVLWGGVIGGIVGGSESLEQAGARLTQRDAPVLNMAVALLGMAVLFGIVFLVVWGLSQLIRSPEM